VPRAEPRGAEYHEARLGWALVLPAVGTILIIALFPLAWTVWESLHLHDLRMPWLGRPFIGLDNYLEALGDQRFREALVHTLAFTVASVTLELTLGCVLALAMNRTFRGRGLVRAAILVPWAIPTVVAALIWRFMFDGDSGIVNAALASLGVDPPVWFVDRLAAWVPVVLGDVWKETPFVALLLLAGLQGIDASLYEAARIDGASAWRQFRHITLPTLVPIVTLVNILTIAGYFQLFAEPYVMTQGGPLQSTVSVLYFMYEEGFKWWNLGSASAVAFLLFLLIFGVTAVQLWLSRWQGVP
jgi:ABC-type sugar transport system permease subunit